LIFNAGILALIFQLRVGPSDCQSSNEDMSCLKCGRDGICDTRRCSKPKLVDGRMKYRCAGECTCKGRQGGGERFDGISAPRGAALPKRDVQEMLGVTTGATGASVQGAAGDSVQDAVVHEAALGAIDEDAAQDAEAQNTVSRAPALEDAVLERIQANRQAARTKVKRRKCAERVSEIIRVKAQIAKMKREMAELRKDLHELEASEEEDTESLLHDCAPLPLPVSDLIMLYWQARERVAELRREDAEGCSREEWFKTDPILVDAVQKFPPSATLLKYRFTNAAREDDRVSEHISTALRAGLLPTMDRKVLLFKISRDEFQPGCFQYYLFSKLGDRNIDEDHFRACGTVVDAQGSEVDLANPNLEFFPARVILEDRVRATCAHAFRLNAAYRLFNSKQFVDALGVVDTSDQATFLGDVWRAIMMCLSSPTQHAFGDAYSLFNRNSECGDRHAAFQMYAKRMSELADFWDVAPLLPVHSWEALLADVQQLNGIGDLKSMECSLDALLYLSEQSVIQEPLDFRTYSAAGPGPCALAWRAKCSPKLDDVARWISDVYNEIQAKQPGLRIGRRQRSCRCHDVEFAMCEVEKMMKIWHSEKGRRRHL
jgi:hypothetical protein